MTIRPLVVILSVFWSFSAAGQVTSEFYLDKTTYVPGEPIFLYFKVSNRLAQPITINTTQLPSQPFCAGYTIKVSKDLADTPQCLSLSQSNSCILNGQTSTVAIEPGSTYTEQILLNPYGNFKSAGNYSIDATYSDSPRRNEFGVTPFRLTAQTNLHLSIDPSAPPVCSDIFQVWVEQLRSPEDRKRMQAARVLTYLAPASFEDVLLGFVDNPDLRGMAPLALHNLSTPRSIAALAAMMDGPLTNQQLEASMYLAQTNDPRWLPLLFKAAQEHARISAFPTAAAELGGKQSVPLLVALEKSSDREFAHLNAVMALGYTGSRAAVPFLLEYLKSPDTPAAERARHSLEMLTHRSVAGSSLKNPPQTEYPKWSKWWKQAGATAPIYPATQACQKTVALPDDLTSRSRMNK
jgi:hypothetical protein